MLNLSKSVQMKKQTHLHSLKVSTFSEHFHLLVGLLLFAVLKMAKYNKKRKKTCFFDNHFVLAFK